MNVFTMRHRAGYAVLAAMAVAAMLVSIVAMPLAVGAASFTIELEKQIIRGESGQRIDLGTFAVPAEIQGLICQVTTTGNNNESVHIGNDIEVSSVNTVVLVGVEDASNKTTVAVGLLELAASVSFTLVLGPDPVYSAELTATFECESPVTTTTAPSTTTTVGPSTTTTVGPSTTTTVAPSTTTTVAPSTTTTVAPTTTTVAPSTTTTVAPTTTEPESTTTTVQVGPTSTDTTPDTLPFTGVDSDYLAAIGFLALSSGAGLVLATRQSAEVRQGS